MGHGSLTYTEGPTYCPIVRDLSADERSCSGRHMEFPASNKSSIDRPSLPADLRIGHLDFGSPLHQVVVCTLKNAEAARGAPYGWGGGSNLKAACDTFYSPHSSPLRDTVHTNPQQHNRPHDGEEARTRPYPRARRSSIVGGVAWRGHQRGMQGWCTAAAVQ